MLSSITEAKWKMDNATIRIITTLVAVIAVFLKHFYAVTRSKEE